MSYEKNAIDRIVSRTIGANDTVVLIPMPEWAGIKFDVEDGFIGQLPNKFLVARRGPVTIAFIGTPANTLDEQLAALRVELEKAIADYPRKLQEEIEHLRRMREGGEGRNP